MNRFGRLVVRATMAAACLLALTPSAALAMTRPAAAGGGPLPVVSQGTNWTPMLALAAATLVVVVVVAAFESVHVVHRRQHAAHA